MRKFLALLLALAMIFTLAACGEGEQKQEEQKTDPTSASVEKTEPSETEPSESESTEPSESESTEPSESESTEPSESESTEPTESESTEPSESEPTIPTETDPTIPTETDPTIPTETEPTAPSVPEGIDPDLIGTWAGSVAINGAMMDMPELDATLTLDMTMAFASNSMCTMTLDEESLREQMPAFLEAMIPAAVEAFYEEMGGEEAAEEAMMELMGMTVTEFYESMFTEDMLDDMFGETSMTQTYTIKNGEIVIDGDGVAYTVEGDKLILTDEDLLEFGMESVELTRIDSADPDIPFVPDEPGEPDDPDFPDLPTIPGETGELDEALFGTWAGSITADGTMMDMPDLDATLTIDLTMTFGEDGVCAMEIDEESLRENISVFLEEAIPYMVQMVYDEMGGEEAAEEMMMETMGMTVTEFYESMFTEDMFIEMIIGSLDETSTEMEYFVVDGLLYIGDTGSEYAIEGDTLILSGGDLTEGLGEMGMESLELTKVA